MLIAGSDDGVYRISGLGGADETSVERVLDTDRVLRVRQFDALDGVFAATESGLYHSPDGAAWTDLGVPREEVFSVCASPSGERLYAGTRPADVYVSTSPSPDGITTEGEPEWRELDGFRDLASREWRKSRHDDVAQVRSLCIHSHAPERVVAGVEVGGVHVSEDGGETWDERNEGVDDVHHVHVVSGEEYSRRPGSDCTARRTPGERGRDSTETSSSDTSGSRSPPTGYCTLAVHTVRRRRGKRRRTTFCSSAETDGVSKRSNHPSRTNWLSAGALSTVPLSRQLTEERCSESGAMTGRKWVTFPSLMRSSVGTSRSRGTKRKRQLYYGSGRVRGL